MTELTRADSRMPTTSSSVAAAAMRMAGTFEDRGRGGPVGQDHSGPRRGAPQGGEPDADIREETDHVTRPADRHGRGAERVFEDEVPADDPRQQLAERRVAVRVRRAGHRHRGRELRIAQRRERADHAGEDHREDDRRPGMHRRRLTGQHEDAGADDGADAERGQVHRAQHALELSVFTCARGQLFNGFGCEDAPACPARLQG